MNRRLRHVGHSTSALAALIAAGCLTACGKPAEPRTCDCLPQPADPAGGAAILDGLRRHVAAVRDGKNPRDVKLVDDDLRFAIVNFCSPCGAWVADRTTIEDLYPLDRLDDAARATCLGLELADGTTVYGNARPRACR